MINPSYVVFQWPVASDFGWGLRGLGYALNWPGASVSASPKLTASLPPQDSRQLLLAERIERSRWFQLQIAANAVSAVQIPEPVLVPLGNALTERPLAFGPTLRGTPHVACPVFEDLEMAETHVDNLKAFDAVVVASRWNQGVLADWGVEAQLCHEGIDSVLFNPSVRNRASDGKFRVFSGGKAEWRKGQDLVIQAFAKFAEAYDDAVLVAAWGSPFAWAAHSFEGKWEYGSPPGLHNNRPNWHAWVQRAGINPRQFEWIEPRPNWQMPAIYANVDCAVFPNRCEGGTSFPTMECIACGIPTLVRYAHGLRDLQGWDASLLMTEEDETVDAIVAWLEARHSCREPNHFIGDMWTWDQHCKAMDEIIRNA